MSTSGAFPAASPDKLKLLLLQLGRQPAAISHSFSLLLISANVVPVALAPNLRRFPFQMRVHLCFERSARSLAMVEAKNDPCLLYLNTLSSKKILYCGC